MVLPPYLFMIALMSVLDLLNIYWAYHIYKVAVEPSNRPTPGDRLKSSAE